MVKRLAMFALAEGQSGDEVWAYWLGKHAKEWAQLPGLRRYTISRVTEVVKGEMRYWGVAEMWTDTKEDWERASGQKEKDEFGSMIGEPRFAVWLEEEVLVEWNR